MKFTVLLGLLSSATLAYGWGDYLAIYDHDCNSAGGGCNTQYDQYIDVDGATPASGTADTHGNAMRTIASGESGLAITSNQLYNYNIADAANQMSSKKLVLSLKGDATYSVLEQKNVISAISVKFPSSAANQLNCAIYTIHKYLAENNSSGSIRILVAAQGQGNVYFNGVYEIGMSASGDCPAESSSTNNAELGTYPGINHCGLSVAVMRAAGKVWKSGTNYGMKGYTTYENACKWLNPAIPTTALGSTDAFITRMDDIANNYTEVFGYGVYQYYLISSSTGTCPYTTGATAVTCSSGTRIRCNLSTNTYQCCTGSGSTLSCV